MESHLPDASRRIWSISLSPKMTRRYSRRVKKDLEYLLVILGDSEFQARVAEGVADVDARLGILEDADDADTALQECKAPYCPSIESGSPP